MNEKYLLIGISGSLISLFMLIRSIKKLKKNLLDKNISKIGIVLEEIFASSTSLFFVCLMVSFLFIFQGIGFDI